MSDFADSAFYRYHERTKHTVFKLESDQHYLDWASQPDPIRRYDGAPLVALPKPQQPLAQEFFTLNDAAVGGNVDLETLSQLFYYSMALSAWKEVRSTGARWALRVNPSSGNLHPTEAHVITRDVAGLPDGVYHFRADTFQLEMRCVGGGDHILLNLHEHCAVPTRGLTIVLTTIFWREAWKYRERAFRYCHHDMGHAAGAIVACCRGLGLSCSARHLFDDQAVASLLGLEDGDEKPCLLLAIGEDSPLGDGKSRAEGWQGVANPLSEEPIDYPAIEAVYESSSRKPCAVGDAGRRLELQFCGRVDLPGDTDFCDPFWTVVRRRRSGVAFDGRTGISLNAFGAILHRASRHFDFDVFQSTNLTMHRRFVHLFVYAHRVEGVEPGVYYYDAARCALMTLELGDQRKTAMWLSLQQFIAAESAFAISMVADFASAYAAFGDRGYRAVHIEAGYIGQGLYLGAESVGTNATGIGAFFDDDVNRYLKLPDGFEVIYHFTVGRAVEDERLQTTKAYPFE